jgi:hypothetical protein
MISISLKHLIISFFLVQDSLFVSHMDWSVGESAGTMGETVARLTLPCLAQR